MKQVDLLIVGGGPAGIAAAACAAQHDLSVKLVNEAQALGGQVLNNTSQSEQSSNDGLAIERGKELLRQLHTLPLDIQHQTIVWAIKDRRVALVGPEGSHEVETSAVIIATGAREFVPPFPGWTLPGVMTLGAAQHLTKWYGVLPGRSILIAGAGPLLWALAATLLEHGGNIAAILDTSQPTAWLKALPQIRAVWDRFDLGWRYLSMVRAHRVPYRLTSHVLKAHGTHLLDSVTVGHRNFGVDTLCVGFGFRPNIELFQLAGCTLRHDPSLGGWIPALDGNLHTDQTGIFAAGECAGVGGAEKALVEGELAAYSALTSLGKPLSHIAEKRLQWLREARHREIGFARVLNHVSQPPVDYLRELEDDTFVCRCENVRAGEIRAAIQHGNDSLNGLKNELRVGQGMCQGRTCGPILQWLLSLEQHPSEHQPMPFHVRPPVKPIRLDQIEGQV